MRLILLVLIILMSSGCSRYYYVVRHAEKETASSNPSDPPLSTEGNKRAAALSKRLKDAKIKAIYATPTQRAMATAKPLSEALGIPTETYGPLPDQKWIHKIRSGNKNALVVGHSNTVDDIVNGLSGASRLQDLPDSVYGKLYIIRQRGKKTTLKEINY